MFESLKKINPKIHLQVHAIGSNYFAGCSLCLSAGFAAKIKISANFFVSLRFASTNRTYLRALLVSQFGAMMVDKRQLSFSLVDQAVFVRQEEKPIEVRFEFLFREVY